MMKSASALPMPERLPARRRAAGSGSRRREHATTPNTTKRSRPSSRHDDHGARPRRPRAAVSAACADRHAVDGACVSAAGEVATRHGHSSAIRRRRTKAMKTGAPMTAVTMPTSSSPGRATTRPMTSAPSSRIGASTAEYGRSQRWSGPVIARATCGTVRPTNPIGPGGRGGGAARAGPRPTPSNGPGRADALAERPGDVVAEGERVQQPARRQRQHDADDDERRDLRHDRRRRGRRASRPPRTGTGRAWRRRAAASPR